MIHIRKANERGRGDHGWLQSFHTFSFASYRDSKYNGFQSLRVINEDRVMSGQGFGTHGHDNMEIISYVLDGALEHKDSMGNGAILTPGEFQCISAGSGITHSEFNPSATAPVHFYQIWLLPNVRDTTPTYQQKRFSVGEQRDQLRLVASPDGREGSLHIKQDARIYLSQLSGAIQVSYSLAKKRSAWLQVLRGRIELNGHVLEEGDGAAISHQSDLTIKSREDSEFMLFDLA